MAARHPARHLAARLALTALVAGPAVAGRAAAQTARAPASPTPGPRVRARALGVAPGVFRPGAHNAITDVAGVRVGQVTVVEGDSVRTGVTAVLPHAGNLFFDRVPAAVHVGNAFGKFVGATQVRELGELETPVLLTCTLCVWRAADALAAELLDAPGMAEVRSINPVVGETNDGLLNAIRARPLPPDAVRRALAAAAGGPVAEGSVGAGAGTVAFGWKGGIGTASRVLPRTLGGWTVGVLVQTNFGGVLQVLGVPVGRELGRYAFQDAVEGERGGGGPRGAAAGAGERGDGSVVIVVATDAPLSDRNLERLAARAIMGLARTGSSAANGSGDYVLAFSTAAGVRRRVAPPTAQPNASPNGPPNAAPNAPPNAAPNAPPPAAELSNDATTPLFQGVVEATEEAIYNSLFMATTVASRGRTVEAIPLDRVRAVLARYRAGGR